MRMTGEWEKAGELERERRGKRVSGEVVTGKRLPRIKAGRSLIAFYFRKDMAAVAAGIEDRKTDTGTMKVSSPALKVSCLVPETFETVYLL
jgi:hypothetical protein